MIELKCISLNICNVREFVAAEIAIVNSLQKIHFMKDSGTTFET